MGVAIPQVITEDKAGGALVIDGGLRFDGSKKQYLTRTPVAGNRRTWTWSGWTKRSILDVYKPLFYADAGGNTNFQIQFLDSNILRLFQQVSGADTFYLQTSQLFRDTTAWYHILVTLDTTRGANANSLKLYVNGVLSTTIGATVYPTLDFESTVNSVVSHYLGYVPGGPYYYDGYMSQVYFIDGQALDASYFGYTDPLTNTWRPKKYKPAATPNNGTTWSSYLTTNAGSNFDGSYPVTNAFDNSSTTKCLTANNANGTTTGTSYIQFNSPSSFSGTLKVICDNGNAVYDLTSGSPVLLATQSTGSDGQLLDCGTVTGISSIRVLMSGGSRPAIGGIYINGVGLIDSLNDTGGVGTNGFYLPFDGNSPIGQDQSGRGNNWTPVNFGGSNTLEKATGALPILNTDGGGKVARVGVRTDPFASNLVLALPLVGIKSDFSNRINSGTIEKAITANGDTVASSAQSNFYGGSFYFDGTGDYLSIPDNADFAFGSGDFTIESWVYINNLSSSYSRSISGQVNSGGGGSNYGHYLEILSTGSVNGGGFEPGVNYISVTTATGIVTTGKWHHIAMVRNGNNLRLYVDGINQATTDVTGKSFTDSSNQFAIGRQGEYNGYYMNGYIQDYRLYKGVAKYTQNFIPASTDPDIVPDTPSGVAYSSTLSLPTSNEGGSLMFDGSGDYLRFSQSSDWAFGTGDFSIEYFIFPNYTTDTLGFGGTRGAAGTSAGWNIGLINEDTAGGYIQMYSDGGIAPTNAHRKILYRKWTHVVYTRSGSTIRAIIDGVLHNTASNSQNWTLNDFSIGITGAGAAEPYLGFLSNIRIIKGSIPTSYQTSSTTLGTKIFDVPTSPLTTTSQGATSSDVKFLGCNSLTAITDFTVTPNTPTVNGNVSVSVFNPFTVNINTQRGQESGYCTLNPLDNYSTTAMTLSNGNLGFSCASGSDHSIVGGTVSVSSGKWFWEITCNTYVSGGVPWMFGVMTSGTTRSSNLGSKATEWAYFSDGRKANNNTATSYGSTFTTSDVIGVALDMDSGSITFYKNGISQGVAYSNLSGYSLVPAVDLFPGNTSGVAQANFGQNPFKFPPPAGFQPLALANTPRPTIVRPDQYVGISTWTGNGVDGRQIGNFSFSPDFVWLKNRTNAGGVWHLLYDTVRGAANRLSSNSSSAENNQSANGYVSAFNRFGFSVTSGSVGDMDVNDPADNYVAWCWKAGGNSNTYNINDIGYSTASAAGLTAGTITPSGASVNTKSGFSIITYTGTGANATISHGIGKAPGFIIVKSRSITGSNWKVYHSSLGATKRLNLDTVDSAAANSTIWNNTEPTSSVFSIGTNSDLGQLNATYVAYLWAEIPGFSKFGTYSGVSSTNGPVVITGFRPKWVLIKRTDNDTENWHIRDATRNPFNLTNRGLSPNTTGIEGPNDTTAIDILSNGFKLRGDDGAVNTGGGTYIYVAFAETPSFNLYGGQANAR